MAWNVFIDLREYFINPYVWAFVAGLPFLYFIYLWIIRLSTPPSTEVQGAGPGCLVQFLGLFLQAFGIAAILLLLLPVLLGVSSQVSWQAVEALGFIAVRSGLFAMILVTTLSFIPVIGKVLGSSPGTEAFLLSWLTFRFLSPLYIEAIAGKGIPTKNLFPPWWIVLLLCALSWLIARLLMVLVFAVGERCKSKGIFQEKGYRWCTSAVGPSLDVLAGILPFLYYARWVAHSLKGI